MLAVFRVVLLLVGVSFGGQLQLYATERRIVFNIALVSMAFVLIVFALSTAIMRYAIARLMQKIIS